MATVKKKKKVIELAGGKTPNGTWRDTQELPEFEPKTILRKKGDRDEKCS